MSKRADLISRSVSVIGVLVILLMFTLAAYLDSFLQGKIDKNIFTVSQALAFGNKPAMIGMLTAGILLMMFLNYYRGLNYLYVRLFVLFLIYALIFSLFWVTTFYNRKDHYILAFVIFISILIHITLTSVVLYQFRKSLGKLSTPIKALLIGLPLFSLIGIIGLILGNVPAIKDKVPELFPSFENYTLFIQGLSFLTLGFV